MEAGILTTVLNQLAGRLSLGYARILPDALVLMRYLVAIEIVIMGVFWALGKSDITVTAIKKITAIGFFLWVVTEMKTLSHVLIMSFAQAGLVAGGNTITLSNLFDPSSIIDMGFRTTKPIFDDIGGFVNIYQHTVNCALQFLAGLIGLFSYFFIAWNLFVVIIEFYLFTVCSVILIPFAVFKPTAWLAERAIGGTFTIGVKLMVLAFIVSITYDIMGGLDLTTASTSHYQLYCAVSLMCVIAYLCWSAPNFAAGIISGGPNLSGSHFLTGAAAFGFAGDRAAATAVNRSVGTVKMVLGAGKYGYNKVKGGGDNTGKAPEVKPGAGGTNNNGKTGNS
ncbi:MAG: P-type conjugative transfer protein TrbL [Desulfomonilia bacterium]|jgi:type IV secretion system protein TrbL